MKTKLFYKIFAFTFGMMLLITVLAHVLIFMIAPSENVLITSTTVTNEDVLAFSEVDMPQLITQTILKSFPLSFACCMVISLVFSFLFSKGITGPILSISTSVHQMSKLDRTAEITVISTDEIGGLANDINSLYQSLLVTIRNLEEEKDKVQLVEKEKIDFLRTASHELKTPLTVLKGHLSGMLNGVVGYENHSKYLQRSLAVTEKMEVLIRELLYISRIEKNKTSIQFANIDFAELLRTVIAELTDFISEKKLSLHINIPDRVSCPLDRAEMERAIQNILINAIRYSPDGEQVIVTVTETNTIISCSIENTGVKIPETTICHLFEPFYRVDISRNSATGGTGLGLYIVRGILENHNAEYGIKNTENGVCFWLRLPKKQ